MIVGTKRIRQFTKVVASILGELKYHDVGPCTCCLSFEDQTNTFCNAGE